MVHRPRPLSPLSTTLAFAAAVTAAGTAGAQDRVVQVENVRVEYAQVLGAEPVYQTLRATSMVERCEQSTPVQAASLDADGDGNGDGQRRGLSRVMGAVKDALTPGPSDDGEAQAPAPATPREGCRMVPVEREFRRPIAYDVDYVHKGVRYRSRLPYDPGNRLKVRVSVMPVVPPPPRP